MNPPAPSAEQTAEQTGDYRVLRWLVLATFIVILNETIMINAIPRLMVELDLDAITAQWLTSAFMLTMAVVIPVTGWFLQRVSTRQGFATAMLVFCTGTLICALAPGFPALLLGRIVQAAGTAVMMPLLMTTLLTLVAERDRGRIMGNVTLTIAVAPALGPAVSGVILEVASWRWMFGVVLPIAAVVTAFGMRRLTNVGETRPGRIDVLSVVLSAVGFGSLVYGLSLLSGEGAAPGLPPALVLGVGVAAVVAFALRQVQLQRSDRIDQGPLLDLRTLRIRTYAIAVALMSVAFMAMIGSMILLPIYLQEVRGLTELQAGLMVMPGGLAMGLLGPKVGRVYDRVGARPLVVPGSIGMLLALGLLTQVAGDTPILLVLPAHLLLMVSLAAIFTPVFTVGLGALPAELYSHGSSLLGTLQQVAAATGTAIVVVVLSARELMLLDRGAPDLAARAGAMDWAFGVGAAFALVVVVLALLLPDRTPVGPAPEAAAIPAPTPAPDPTTTVTDTPRR